MHIMALIGDVEKVKEMISKGEDANACDDHGRTVLYYGAGGGSLEIVELLVTHGADVNKAATQWPYIGKTPLYIASQKGYLTIIDYLIRFGADMNKADNDG